MVIGVVERLGIEEGFDEEGATGEVKLRAPLGTRSAYDARDGSRMVQSGPSPGDPPCPERPPPDTPLQRAIEEREQYGMNTDPAYVQALLDGDRTFTEHEQRCPIGRIDFEQRVDDYVQHWGGTSVVGRYPEPPYLLVRLLRRRPSTRSDCSGSRAIRCASRPPNDINDDARLTDDFLGGYGRDGFFVTGPRATRASRSSTSRSSRHGPTPRRTSRECKARARRGHRRPLRVRGLLLRRMTAFGFARGAGGPVFRAARPRDLVPASDGPRRRWEIVSGFRSFVALSDSFGRPSRPICGGAYRSRMTGPDGGVLGPRLQPSVSRGLQVAHARARDRGGRV